MRRILLLLLIFSASVMGAQPVFFDVKAGLGGGLFILDDSRFAAVVAPDLIIEGEVCAGVGDFRASLLGGIHSQADARSGVVIYRGFWGPYWGLDLGWNFPLSNDWSWGLDGMWKVAYSRYHYLPYDFLIMSLGLGGSLEWKPFIDIPLIFTGKLRWEHRLDGQLSLNTGLTSIVSAGWRF